MEGGVVRVAIAGGTGGHVFPALSVARELRAGPDPVQLLWVGQADSLKQRTAAADDIPFAAVAVGKLRRDRNPLRMLTRDGPPDRRKPTASVGSRGRRSTGPVQRPG
ncbi:glycosyltransferase [Nocardia albiluteola]|uniref:glycosyltransferase n=1 Tax=Nocardia albiluteola TaxID=2842303 RepID=UPI001FD95159|nr:glycosyltransferase [Nocardia albiluteola]